MAEHDYGRDGRPLHARWERHSPGLWLVPAVVAVGLFLACVPLLLDRRLPPARFLSLAVGFFLAVGLSVSMVDGMQGEPGELQLPGFVMPLEYREHDYFGDVPLVRRLGVKRFVSGPQSTGKWPLATACSSGW